jgi:hypothetical protein
MGYFVSLAKDGRALNKPELRKYVSKHVSNVRRKVKKNRTWTPENVDTIIATTDAKALYLTMGVYEYDNGRIYKKLVEQSDVLIDPEDFDWSVITLPEDITSVMGWVKSLWKVISHGFNYLMEDDLLGTITIAIPDITDESKRQWTGLRELKFKSWGGDYRVMLSMEIIDE